MKIITLKIRQSSVYLISQAMKTKDYKEGSEWDKLQKELEIIGQLSDTVVKIEND